MHAFAKPSRRKLKYAVPIFIVLSLFSFSSLVYSNCPAFVQCSEAELRSGALCTQACTANFNVLLFVVIALVSYLLPAVIIHHNER
jgi:hypothetical protein